MSRNLANGGVCTICYEKPVVVGPVHPIRDEECPSVYVAEYRGMQVADAECPNCKAKYLAWMSSPPGWRRPYAPPDKIIDLSFRSTFNDEPGPSDLPTPEKLQELHVRDTRIEARRVRAEAMRLLEAADKLEDDRNARGPYWELYRRA